ncbi:MAG TPA: alanine--tRNA ligase [Kofleriaceae bacterium]|nr:alanine--tRNA ligase [Kofleriaceae bacterium]
MKADQVRAEFLDFFAERGHQVVRSSSLVPENDPTLLFNNAGMNQFKDVFTGRETRSYKRAATSQKCVRAGGKHNDLDEVGKTPRHHTFFEMLGNFSFGDYFKEDAIAWAWELLVGRYQIDPSRLIVTVFGGDKTIGVGADDEARAIWRKVTGFGDDRVVGLGMADNFWMMGETGPMGPCSEIHYHMPGAPKAFPTTTSPKAAWDGWLEIWNLVFMQFERKVAGGPLDRLPAPSIDTGAGLERVTSVLQGVQSNYDTDLFQPLIRTASEISGVPYGKSAETDMSMRVIADHARASAFLIADGVFPDKTTREYVLRRIFRRAVRHGKLLGIEEPFMHRVCASVVERMAAQFPELRERARVIEEVTLEEEKRFRATIDRGLGILEEEFARMGRAGGGAKQVPGAVVFKLHDTYGFPQDLTEIIAGERGFTIDEKGFEAAMQAAVERSRFQGEGEAVADDVKQLEAKAGATEFLGYDATSADGVVVAAQPGAGGVVLFACDRTPFYAEQGGQMGDTGWARGPGVRVRVTDTKKSGETIIHKGVVEEGQLAAGAQLTLEVDEQRRDRIRANHSATHLLHLALKRVLGDHVAQKGSLVAPDRLRFDFAHGRPVTPEQVAQVEDLVNAEVWKNADSTVEVLPFAEAKQRGAVAMFGEKYGERVRVVRIGGESLEFCGGTHGRRAGDIGLFKILSESGIAQGVRRIEAVTTEGALEHMRRLEGELARAGAQMKVAPLEVAGRVERMAAEVKQLERELAQLKAKLASGGARDLMSEVADVGGVKVLVTQTDVDDARALRETGDSLKSRLGSGVIVLAGVGADKVSLLAMVTDDLTDRFHAGKLLQTIAEVMGGKGGGRPDMAQGGGRDASKLPEALARARALVQTWSEARN